MRKHLRSAAIVGSVAAALAMSAAASSALATTGDNVTTTPGGTVIIGSGATLTDSADLTAASVLASPTGTITFYLFDPGVTPNGTNSNNVYSDTVTVQGAGTYTTTGAGISTGSSVPTTVGTYQWIATYNGNDPSISTNFGDEPETVSQATPSISTMQEPATASVGSSIADEATVSGGDNPTGSVTFNLYNSPTATGTPLFTSTVPLVGGSANSTGYTTTATGTDYWVATYDGDSNNNAVASGTACEPVSILPVSPANTAASVAGCSTVPASEPASFALLAAGLGFLGLVRRRSA